MFRRMVVNDMPENGRGGQNMFERLNNKYNIHECVPGWFCH